MPTNYADRLSAAIAARGTPAVVGIDPVLERLPTALAPRDKSLAAAVDSIERFSRTIIDIVAPRVPAVKINSGFFEAFYELGVAAYFRLVQHAHQRGLIVIGDVKRGDIGSTSALYARGHVATPNFSDVDPARIPDAVTLSGYLGHSGVKEFIEVAAAAGRGVYVLVRPSDPTADLISDFGDWYQFYEFMGKLVREWGAAPHLVGECGLSCVGAVVGAKDVETTAELRAAMPQTPYLVPGFGAQGAARNAVRACFRDDGAGAIVNASRSVIFAFAEPARQGATSWEKAVEAACDEFAQQVASIARSGSNHAPA